MFAVFKTGGKQYRVAAEDLLKVDKVKGEPGEIVEFGEVLVVGGDSLTLGAPTVAGATVAAEVLEQARGPKVIAFKKRRRKNSRRKRGHRNPHRGKEGQQDGATEAAARSGASAGRRRGRGRRSGIGKRAGRGPPSAEQEGRKAAIEAAGREIQVAGGKRTKRNDTEQ